MSEHTPTPWVICPDEPKWIITTNDEIRDDIICQKTDDPPIDRDNWESNATFIVEACNNHARLTRENEAMRKALQEISGLEPGSKGAYAKFETARCFSRAVLASLKEPTQ